MAQSSSDRLQFSINESVWLRDDAPAEEILSMALEPDITVEENWNDVTIKGFLRLSGEYKPVASDSTVADSGATPFRTIDEIVETTNGTDVLEHRFPIDITIPADRVPDIEHLFVIIESFDYELSEQRHIQLQADLAITGLAQPAGGDGGRKEKAATQPAQLLPLPETKDKVYHGKKNQTAAAQPASAKKAGDAEKPAVLPQQVKPDVAAKVVLPSVAEKSADQKPITASSGHSKASVTDQANTEAEKAAPKPSAKPDAVIQGNEKPKASKARPEKGIPSAKSAGKVAGGNEQGSQAHKRSDRFNSIPFALPEDLFTEMPTDRQDFDPSQSTFGYQAFRKPEPAEEAQLPQPQLAFSERSEAQPAPEPAAVEPPAAAGSQETAAPSEASSLYLTKVLAGNEEEQKTRVKIYIVQAGDSLESISDHYKVPLTSLLRQNRLASAAVEAGELLYIPRASTTGKVAQE
ncbi:MAG: LysM peptidoglycan-binding domain-containing protein [Sporolactobacillus sp.]